MKYAIFALLFLLTLVLAAAWLFSWTSRPAMDFTISRHSCHVAAERGSLSLAIFSTEAEDEERRDLAFPLWLAVASLFFLTAAVGFLLHRDRRRRRAVGFPLAPAAETTRPGERAG